MKVTNTLAAKNSGGIAKEKNKFTQVISGASMQKLIATSLRDNRAAARFTTTLISVVNASEQLRNCEPASVIAAALRGEGMGLNYGTGYYVVPYGSKATFLIGYRGFIQLCLATGQYADIDCIDVREGERKGRDKRTGKPIVDMSVYDTDEERERHPIIGYKAYFELKDGYYREEYWTVDQILQHADRYSTAFSLDTFRKWQNGEKLDPREARSVEGSPWYDISGGQQRMAKKTVLRSLLNSGYAPISNEVRFMVQDESDDGVIAEDLDLPDLSGATVDENTGEVIETEAVVVEQETEPTPEPETAPVEKKRGRKPAPQTAPVADEPEPAVMDADDDFTGGFFG